MSPSLSGEKSNQITYIINISLSKILDKTTSFVCATGVDLHDVHVRSQETTRVSNIDCSLLFVARDNPNFDTGSSKIVDGMWDAVLELVFDGCCSQQSELPLYSVIQFFDLNRYQVRKNWSDYCHNIGSKTHSNFAILDQVGSCNPLCAPLEPLFFTKLPVTKD